MSNNLVERESGGTRHFLLVVDFSRFRIALAHFSKRILRLLAPPKVHGDFADIQIQPNLIAAAKAM